MSALPQSALPDMNMCVVIGHYLAFPQPNNGLSGLLSWINAYRRQFFLLNLSARGLYGSFS
jgi:hypothetical protein